MILQQVIALLPYTLLQYIFDAGDIPFVDMFCKDKEVFACICIKKIKFFTIIIFNVRQKQTSAKKEEKKAFCNFEYSFYAYIQMKTPPSFVYVSKDSHKDEVR